MVHNEHFLTEPLLRVSYSKIAFHVNSFGSEKNPFCLKIYSHFLNMNTFLEKDLNPFSRYKLRQQLCFLQCVNSFWWHTTQMVFNLISFTCNWLKTWKVLFISIFPLPKITSKSKLASKCPKILSIDTISVNVHRTCIINSWPCIISASHY